MPSNFHIPAISGFGMMYSDRLSQKHFHLTLAFALLLHVAVIAAWQMTPRPQIIDVPVRALNIKLGDGDISDAEIMAAEPSPGNTSVIENTISRLVRDPVMDQVRTDSVISSMDKAMDLQGRNFAQPPAKNYKMFDMRSEGMKPAAPVMGVVANEVRQYVREAPTKAEIKSPAGNSNAKDAEIVKRYEQLISLWIEKFKVYPEDAKSQGMSGTTVARIRIDRRGNIRYYALESTTGWPTLDRAAIDMVRRANPVPAAPNDYPPGAVLEFLVPVNFELK